MEISVLNQQFITGKYKSIFGILMCLETFSNQGYYRQLQLKLYEKNVCWNWNKAEIKLNMNIS